MWDFIDTKTDCPNYVNIKCDTRWRLKTEMKIRRGEIELKNEKSMCHRFKYSTVVCLWNSWNSKL